MEHKKLLNNSTAGTILLVIFSLIASLLLWVYVTETEGEDVKQPFSEVRVVFDGESTMRESQGLIISEKSATSVRVELTGSRRTIAGLRKTDLSVSIDLSDIVRTGNYSRTPEVNYPAGTDTSAITAVTSPSSIAFYVDRLDKKTLEVRGTFNGSAAEGFSANPLVFSPATVTIYGPSQVLDEVAYAQVDVNRTDVDHTLTFDSVYTLIDNDGNGFESDEVTFDTDTVNVTLPIRAVKDVTLTVELIAGGGATERDAKLRLDPDHITLSGDSDVLAGVNTIVLDRIDLSQVDEPMKETYRIVIPNDTEIISGARETEMTLELQGLASRTFTINKSNISLVNVSEGYVADVINDALENVVIRGPAEMVAEISDVNVWAMADLTDYGTATRIVSVPVRIYVNGAADVGAVGEYSVYVNIAEAPEESDAEETPETPDTGG